MNLKKSCVILALILCAAILTGCGAKAPTLNRYQSTFMDVFDTVSSVIGYAPDEETFTVQVQKIHDGLQEYHRLYDIYHEYDGIVNLCTVNRHPAETLTVDRKIIDLLLFAKEIAEVSGGRTDVTLGSVLSLWHTCREAGIADPEHAKLPDGEALREAAMHTGFDKITVDRENCTVCLNDPEVRLDVGAIAKGYAVQQVCDTIDGAFLISVGGNVFVTGPRADGTDWVVGIQDPDGTGNAYLHTLNTRGGSVVTSGDYQRLYIVDGVRYHHIIDPETLYPGAKWRAVTVVCPDSGMADALSTTLFLTEKADGEKLAASYGAEAMWVSADGEISCTAGYEKLIRK